MAGVKGRSGGRRPGAGRPRKSEAELALSGTLRKVLNARRASERQMEKRIEATARRVQRDASKVLEDVVVAASAEIEAAKRTQAPPTVEAPPPMPKINIQARIQEVYDQLAPLAKEVGTLNARSEMAFRDLCETVVLKQEMLATIMNDGMMPGGKPHGLLARYTSLNQHAQVGFERFKLSAAEGSEDPEDDDFAEFDQPPGMPS